MTIRYDVLGFLTRQICAGFLFQKLQAQNQMFYINLNLDDVEQHSCTL